MRQPHRWSESDHRHGRSEVDDYEQTEGTDPVDDADADAGSDS